MATIIVLQDGQHLGPGRLGVTLRDHGFKINFCRVDKDGADAVPADMDNAQGLVVLGSPTAPTSDEPWIERAMSLIRQAHEAEMPVIGLCMGHQLIARALGGEVEKLDTMALGFEPVELTVPGQTETMVAGIPWSTPMFQSHAYHVSKPPPGATVLAKSTTTPVECFKVGIRTYGFQYHFEFDRPGITRHVAIIKRTMGVDALGAEELEQQLEAHYDRFARASDRLCVNIAAFALPFDRLLAV
ncbi:MAG: type 1 glutamine amidotransferase [Phycisphaerales bacterium]|jgi:GMP synthase (glutamine-hydrolysing)